MYLTLALLQIIYCQTAILGTDADTTCVATVAHHTEPDAVSRGINKTKIRQHAKV